MTPLASLEHSLSTKTRMRVDLVLNKNRTTMIRVLEHKRKHVRLSLHQMFLAASEPVVQALVSFIQNKRDRASSVLLQDYINQNLPSFCTQNEYDPSRLVTKGDFFDLTTLYQELNAQYFQNELKLHITWYGSSQKRRGTQMVYGLYNDPLKLIKIHRLLDQKNCSVLYLSFVIYHEMLHSIYRPKKGKKRTCIHTPEFKAQEKQFIGYEEAISWEKKSRHLFFK